ncbi:MAG TPA: ferritin-like fold-containing protein [Rhodoglobus sp.]|nr:ferritin-like fold-containing protein [Rhodoglobus sp.]
MAAWFRRRRKRPEAPRLRSRGEEIVTTRVELQEFTPPLLEFLGRAAYVELTLFEYLSRAVATAPSVAAKAAIGEVAELTLARHRALVDEIAETGTSPADAMEPYTGPADDFERHLRDGDWYETLVTCYLTTGFLDDFFATLASGLQDADAERVAAIFRGRRGVTLLAAELEEAIDANPRLAARLAMWGRRVVGDTMLLARSVLHFGANHDSDEARIEPVFSELIAVHTRRMDALGLTA